MSKKKTGWQHERMDYILPRIEKIIKRGEYISKEDKPLHGTILKKIFAGMGAYSYEVITIRYKTKDKRGKVERDVYKEYDKYKHYYNIKDLDPNIISKMYIKMWQDLYSY